MPTRGSVQQSSPHLPPAPAMCAPRLLQSATVRIANPLDAPREVLSVNQTAFASSGSPLLHEFDAATGELLRSGVAQVVDRAPAPAGSEVKDGEVMVEWEAQRDGGPDWGEVPGHAKILEFVLGGGVTLFSFRFA